MKKKVLRGLLALLLAGAFALGLCALVPRGEAAAASPIAAAGALDYTSVPLKTGTISQTVISTGSLAYDTAQTVLAPEAVTLDTVFVASGDRVKAGDALAAYDTDALQASLDQARADLHAKDSEIASLAASQSAEAKLTSPLAGIVKALSLQAGQMVQETLLDGPAALLSLDGLMQVEITPSQALSPGQDVKVALGTTRYAGTVIRLYGDKALVTFPDTRAAINDMVSVLVDTSVVGTGPAAVHLPFPVYTTLDGVVSEVSVTLNAQVRRGGALYEVSGLGSSAEYKAALKAREDLCLDIKALAALIASPRLLSPAEGIVKDLAALERVPLEKGAEVLRLYTGGSMVMNIDVDELDILQVALGQRGSVLMDARPSFPYQASVSRISSLGTSAGGIATFQVTLKVEGDESLLMGMNGTATLTVGESKNAVLVPLAALFTDRGGSYVWVYQEGFAGSNETPGVKTYVQTGLSDEDYAAVTGGLSAGQSVMVKNSAAQSTGTRNLPLGGFGDMGTRPGNGAQPAGGPNNP
ncbi:MAG: efflux RND transporter periplasmic adaptor subunit [Christensenellales bacterium]